MRQHGLPHDQPISELALPFAPPASQEPDERDAMTAEERTAFAMRCRCCS
jgi:hypothetical protein